MVTSTDWAITSCRSKMLFRRQNPGLRIGLETLLYPTLGEVQGKNTKMVTRIQGIVHKLVLELHRAIASRQTATVRSTTHTFLS